MTETACWEISRRPVFESRKAGPSRRASVYVSVAVATLPVTVTTYTTQIEIAGFRAERKAPNAAAVSAGTGGGECFGARAGLREQEGRAEPARERVRERRGGDVAGDRDDVHDPDRDRRVPRGEEGA